LGSKSYVAAIRNIDISEFKEGELKKENISVKYRLFLLKLAQKVKNSFGFGVSRFWRNWE
jgi:hypothetical protein